MPFPPLSRALINCRIRSERRRPTDAGRGIAPNPMLVAPGGQCWGAIKIVSGRGQGSAAERLVRRRVAVSSRREAAPQHEAANWTIDITSHQPIGPRVKPAGTGRLRREAEEREAAQSAPAILEGYHARVREAEELMHPPPDQPWPSQAAADTTARGEWPLRRATLSRRISTRRSATGSGSVSRFRRSGTSASGSARRGETPLSTTTKEG